MPVTLQPTSLKYKDTNGQFQSINAIKGEDYVLTEQDKEDIAGLVDVPVQDVQINGTSILQNGVAEIPIASSSAPGIVRTNSNYGITMRSSPNQDQLCINGASNDAIKSGNQSYAPIVPTRQHTSTFYGLAKAAGSDEKNSTLPVGQYTESAKSAISTMLNGPVTVTGTTPTITALPGIRYVCGEVLTLDITLPASGIVDVVFESGSTLTVLTITPPTGQTVKWANGFDPTQLRANTIYEIRVVDGMYGEVMIYSNDTPDDSNEKLIYTWEAPNNYEKRIPLEIDLENNRIKLDDVSNIPSSYGSRYQYPVYIAFDPVTPSSSPGDLPFLNRYTVLSIKTVGDNWVSLSTNDTDTGTLQSTCKLNGWCLWIKTKNDSPVVTGSLKGLDTTHIYKIKAFAAATEHLVGFNVLMDINGTISRIRQIDGNSLGVSSYETIGLRGQSNMYEGGATQNVEIDGSLFYKNGVWYFGVTFEVLNPNNSSTSAKYVAKRYDLITAFNNYNGFDSLALTFGNYAPPAIGSYLKVYDMGKN